MKIISRRRPRSIRCSYSSNADEESCLPLVAVLEDQTCNGNSSSHSVNRDDASSASVRYSSSASHRSTSSSFRPSPQQRWLLLTTVLLTLLLSTTEVALSFSVVPSLHSLPVTGYCRRRQQEKEKEESSDSSSSCGAKTTCSSSSSSTFLQPYYAARQRQQQRAGATQLQAVAIAKSPSTGGEISDPVSISRSSHDHHHYHLQQQQQQLMKEHLDQQQQQLNRQQQQQKRRTPCTTTTTTTTSKHTANTKQQLHSTASSSLSTSTSSSSCPVAEAWARKYTSVDALRETFGGNKNPLWGDLDAASARKLYKTLLPKALLELHQYYTRQLETTSTATTKEEHDKSSSSSTGSTTTSTAAASSVVATDLAPLAYQARVAAKLYTRERCRLPVRVAANLYDGFRQWRKTGKFNMHGMSYQQVWDKYANDIMAVENADQLSQEELAAKIGLKILERACVTNPVIDRLVLRNDNDDIANNSKKKQRHANRQDKKAPLSTAELQQITAQLEEDVERLLWPAVEEWEQSHHATATTASTASTATSSRGQGTTRRRSTSLPPTTSTTTAPTANRYRTLRQLALMKRNLSRLKPPPAESSSSSSTTTTTTTTTTSTPASSKHDHPWQERTHSFIPDRRPRVWQDRPRPQRQH